MDCSTGTFTGEKLSGTVTGPSADWARIRPDGTMGLDVRLLLTTDDGAGIYMTYTGVGTEKGTVLRTAPLFETGDERYAWLNGVQAVGIGTGEPDKVTYQVYRVL